MKKLLCSILLISSFAGAQATENQQPPLNQADQGSTAPATPPAAGPAQAADKILEVAQDGSRQFNGVEEALAAIPADGENYTVKIHPGTYTFADDTRLILDKPGTKLVGTDRNACILQGRTQQSLDMGSQSLWGGIVQLGADRCELQNLTIINRTRPGIIRPTHAMAVRVGNFHGQRSAENCVIANCDIRAYTLDSTTKHAADTVVVAATGRNATIKNCSIYGSYDHVSNGSVNLKVTNCDMHANPGKPLTSAIFWQSGGMHWSVPDLHGVSQTISHTKIHNAAEAYIINAGGTTEFVHVTAPGSGKKPPQLYYPSADIAKGKIIYSHMDVRVPKTAPPDLTVVAAK